MSSMHTIQPNTGRLEPPTMPEKLHIYLKKPKAGHRHERIVEYLGMISPQEDFFFLHNIKQAHLDHPRMYVYSKIRVPNYVKRKCHLAKCIQPRKLSLIQRSVGQEYLVGYEGGHRSDECNLVISDHLYFQLSFVQLAKKQN